VWHTDIWHVSTSPRLSYNIINACVLGDRLPKGIVFDNNRKALRRPRPMVSRRRWRLCWTVFGVYIYIYIMQISERTSTAPRPPLWTGRRDKTNQKRTITTTHDLRYSCGAAAFARLTCTRHFRIIIIRKSSTVTRGTILLLCSIISRHSLLMDCGAVLEPYIIWEILQVQCDSQAYFTLWSTEFRSWWT